MNRERAIAIFLSFALWAGPVHAEPKAKKLAVGDPAPFAGILIPPGRAIELSEAELEVDEIGLTLEAKKLECKRIETIYVAKLEAATKPPPWWKSPKYNLWLGFGLGVVATGAAFWGASQLTK